MYPKPKAQPHTPVAYSYDNARSGRMQILNPHSIGKFLGLIRSTGDTTPPEHGRSVIGAALAADWLLRQIDRAGRVMDSGDIFAGMTTAMTTSNSLDTAEWAATNVLILSVIGYLVWPAGKRLVRTIHKRAMERYTRISRPRAEVLHG